MLKLLLLAGAAGVGYWIGAPDYPVLAALLGFLVTLLIVINVNPSGRRGFSSGGRFGEGRRSDGGWLDFGSCDSDSDC